MSSLLKQLPNFPAFIWSQEALQPVLLRLRVKQSQLLKRAGTLPLELKEIANADMLKKDAFGHIFIEKGIDFIENEAKNGIIILKGIIQKSHQTLTKEHLFNLHSEVSTAFSNQIIDNQYEFEESTEKLLDQFLVWFNKPGLDRILKAAIAHLWFLAIAPFEKNNKTIAGIIADIQLAKADGSSFRFYSLGSQFAAESEQYKFILNLAQSGSLDITIWLQWYLGCLESAYDNAEDQLAPIFAKANFLNAHSEVQLNKRQQKMIEKLLLGQLNELTTTAYAIFVSCSRDTALRDVTDLIKKGILHKAGGLGKNTRYVL